jgi:Zn-dependent protease
MLLVAVALAALVGIVFAAPGATVIYGNYMTREQNGKISAAGPITNIILCLPFVAMLMFGGMMAGLSGSLITIIGLVGFRVNAMIAAFNMLPVSVLDGKKVLAWNPAVFGILFALSFAAVFASFYI